MIWTYDAMHKYYTKQDMLRDPLYEIVYPIIYESKKPSKRQQEKVEPFIKQNIKFIGESPVQDYNRFPSGVYLVYPDKNDVKKWLYFVTPSYVQCDGTQYKELLANHLTFCHDKSDKKKSCHFHSTHYHCTTLPNNTIEFNYLHRKDFFPDKLTSFDGILKDNRNIIMQDFIFDVMKYPYEQHNGGGHRGEKANKHVARPISNKRFCDLWEPYKLKSITCFGFANKDIVVFTIKVMSRGRIISNRLYPAFVLRCNKGIDYEVKIQEFLVQQIPKHFQEF